MPSTGHPLLLPIFWLPPSIYSKTNLNSTTMKLFNTITQAIKDVPTAYKVSFNATMAAHSRTKLEKDIYIKKAREAALKAGMTSDKKAENTQRLKNAKKTVQVAEALIWGGIICAIID